jgi:hypothetical protein
VLSDNGDHPMTRLSDTQLVILSAAAQREDLSVLPLPDSLTLKGGALNKVMDSLRNRGLIRVLGGDGGPERVVITSEGMAAIGVETRTTRGRAPPRPTRARRRPMPEVRRLRPPPRQPRPTARTRGASARPKRRRQSRARLHRPRSPCPEPAPSRRG